MSHRRPTRSGLNRSVRATVLSAAAATAAATLGGAPASADPQEAHEAAKAAVDRLYGEAEKATEQFNAAGENADRLRARVNRAQDAATRGQEAINTMRAALGSLAGAQYRSGGIDPSLALLLSSGPDTYLERAAALDRVSARQSVMLHKLGRAQRRAVRTRAEATAALAELERNRAAAGRHKRTVQARLARAGRLLNSLPAEEREELGRASRSDRSGHQEAAPASADAPGSARAGAALMAAARALGSPYVWGAAGPSAFDCSGLTQWAYAQAGVSLPRTSQAQRSAGRMVSLSQAGPGDLVAYRADASHIGMYAGNGRVIHAPYPGAPVRYDPVGMMPVSSVTRI